MSHTNSESTLPISCVQSSNHKTVSLAYKCNPNLCSNQFARLSSNIWMGNEQNKYNDAVGVHVQLYPITIGSPKACIVCKMGWGITEMIRDKEARRLQKTRKSTAKMGGLCEERSEQGRGGRKCQQGPIETNYKSSRTAEWQLDQPHPYKRETRGRTWYQLQK